jgi:hypothetical protein
MEREKKQENIAGLSIQEDQQEKKTETNVKLDSSVRTVTDGWPMKHTQGVYCHGQKKRGRKARSTAVCLIFVFFQDFENVGRTFGCCLRAEKQQLLAPRMETGRVRWKYKKRKTAVGEKNRTKRNACRSRGKFSSSHCQ